MNTPPEHPLIFTGYSVSGIREGRKTMTRRIVDPDADHNTGLVNVRRRTFDLRIPHHVEAALARCPHGVAGDRIWVKETWQHRDGKTLYRADTIADGWRSSMFMPRWASRLTLEILSVRVERLQMIIEEDARAEGAALPETDGPAPTHRAGFAMAWNAINCKRAPWASNPFVWVIGFRRLEVPRA